jgi:hypothetical protein
MSFTFGLGNPTLDIKSNFVANYGSYAEPYNALDYMGYQKFNTQWPYLIAVVGLIFMILSFIFGKQQVDLKTNQPIEKTNSKKILTGLGWLFLLCTLFGAGYGIYLYFAVYIPQYAKWFESLPSQAKANVGMMSTLDRLTSSTQNRQGTTISFN